MLGCEARIIICDEAFFTTKNRCEAFIDMLMIQIIHILKEISEKFPNLLDYLVFRKQIIFAGDPYQLAVSVEQKNAGVEILRLFLIFV